MCKTANIRTVAWLSLGLLVSACSSSGGDGDGSSNNGENGQPKAQEGAPEVTVTSSFRQLHFNWDPHDGDELYRVSENPDGASGFTEIAEVEDTEYSKDIVVHQHDWTNASYLVEACQGAECIPSLEISTQEAVAGAIGYLKAPNTDANDEFGQSIAMSDDGQTLVVGAHDEASAGAPDDNSVRSTGAAYVFTKTDTGWEQEAYLKASDIELDDDFGHSVAVSGDGNTIAVGVPWEENSRQDNYHDAGAVYVFSRVEGEWVEQGYLRASTARNNGVFGFTVSLSDDGNLLAVGAPGEDREDANAEGEQTGEVAFVEVVGEVYLFSRSEEGVWQETAALVPSNLEVSDRFGYSVALSGDGSTLAVGANQESSGATGINGDGADNSQPEAGAVYVFTPQEQVWTQQAYLKAPNAAADNQFGYAVAIDDSGNWIAVGARYDNDGAGGVHLFNRSSASWSYHSQLQASNADARDYFGTSIAMSDDASLIAVGASWEDSEAVGLGGNMNSNAFWNSGAVYLFEKEGEDWLEAAYIKASNTQIEAQFGHSVALDGSGDALAASAVMEDSGSTGFGGDQADATAENSGAVYLY